MDRKWIWASASIIVMWTAVLLIGLYAPNLVIVSAGGDSVDLPVAVLFVGLLAFVATIVVAVVGFRDGTGAVAERRLGELEGRVAETEMRLAHIEEPVAPARVLRAQG